MFAQSTTRRHDASSAGGLNHVRGWSLRCTTMDELNQAANHFTFRRGKGYGSKPKQKIWRGATKAAGRHHRLTAGSSYSQAGAKCIPLLSIGPRGDSASPKHASCWYHYELYMSPTPGEDSDVLSCCTSLYKCSHSWHHQRTGRPLRPQRERSSWVTRISKLAENIEMF